MSEDIISLKNCKTRFEATTPTPALSSVQTVITPLFNSECEWIVEVTNDNFQLVLY